MIDKIHSVAYKCDTLQVCSLLLWEVNQQKIT